MAYSELIKSFDRIRDYMRDFFIYGYKTRADFDAKSARTYDNERRRIESLAGAHMRFETRRNGKIAFFSMDASKQHDNPFHAAWQSKSFTDNDIRLHFLILDVLAGGEKLCADDVTDAINLRYGEEFDAQTVRNKLREYDRLHLLCSQREGKSVLYSNTTGLVETTLNKMPNTDALLSFFSAAAPLGVIGSYIMNRACCMNEYFLFKHRFVSQTLDDGILLQVLTAIRNKRKIRFTNISGRDGRLTEVHGLPVKVLASTQTGRQYLILERGGRLRYPSYRLDYIKAVELLELDTNGEEKHRVFDEISKSTWGLSHQQGTNLERIIMTVAVDEEKEQYIINRLEREKRSGSVERVSPGIYQYAALVNDTSELLPWIRTFTGRIVSLEGTNVAVIQRFQDDLCRMREQYACGGGDA